MSGAPAAPTPACASARSASGDLVLIVDDLPDNLALLHDALDESGYTVLVATHGAAALERAAQARPDIVLLDALMPEMDGFEVARRLKAQPATAHIPIIFMTGLTETEHLVAALEAGGIDYLTKPIKPRELLARMLVHLAAARSARLAASQAQQARNALDAFGYASLTVRAADGRILWQTPLARELLQRWFGAASPWAPDALRAWLQRELRGAQPGADPGADPPRLVLERGAQRLLLRLHRQAADASPGQAGQADGDDDWLIVMREASDSGAIAAMSRALQLTAREAQVLHWVVQGKINRDIASILGASPATVKKHLEHVFAKLGVETRTAAAAMAIHRMRQLHPQFDA